MENRVEEGLCTVFIQHTSASLTIQENADPSARRDLEGWLNRLVPENDPRFTHTSRGPGRYALAHQVGTYVDFSRDTDSGWPAGAGNLAGNIPLGTSHSSTHPKIDRPLVVGAPCRGFGESSSLHLGVTSYPPGPSGRAGAEGLQCPSGGHYA